MIALAIVEGRSRLFLQTCFRWKKRKRSPLAFDRSVAFIFLLFSSFVALLKSKNQALSRDTLASGVGDIIITGYFLFSKL